jgi:GH25 family lysozyme M1 (1,4-beta-N-acetylmuramidase)
MSNPIRLAIAKFNAVRYKQQGVMGWQGRDWRQRVFQDAVVNPGDEIDVSFYQGTIVWSQVSAAGVSATFIRAKQGLYIYDSKFAVNWAGALAAGIPRGAYIFDEPTHDGAQMAQSLYDFIVAQGSGLGELPVVLDLEPAPGRRPTQWFIDHRQAYFAHILAFCNKWYSLTGEFPIIYTGAWFADLLSPWPVAITALPVWAADYYGSLNKPRDWENWLFWQYTSSGTVPGILYRTDLNRFNGTAEQLQQYIESRALPYTPPAPPPFQVYQVRVIAAWLTVRAGPGTQYRRVGYLAFNATRWVREESGDGWGRIDTGWINLSWTRRI